ncbi:unnamed protein product [Phaeothamnion confervicola]
MKAVAIAALVAALLPALAAAQENKGPPTVRSDAEKAEDAASERAYRNALDATRAKGQSEPAKVDPWQTVRPPAGDKKR